MLRYEFEWDDEKARFNERKHGVAFDEARSCFLDLFAIESFDVDHSLDEDRFVIMGKSERGHLLVVAFTLREQTTIRITSAREARRQERLDYEKQVDSR
ncbi:MAG TPA: BrnT family toxin [Thermoanaerobaculia bacterium]|nr:BrnT family toxin [Thermoanaerobaculia bacterium]